MTLTPVTRHPLHAHHHHVYLISGQPALEHSPDCFTPLTTQCLDCPAKRKPPRVYVYVCLSGCVPVHYVNVVYQYTM